jgi:DMSO/TMAO reductase YedYZ molybdopterin-dependent catalytic subunit
VQEAGTSQNATVVIFHASDGYTTALPVNYIIQNNIMIAYKMHGVTLTPKIGWPLEMVIQTTLHSPKKH